MVSGSTTASHQEGGLEEGAWSETPLTATLQVPGGAAAPHWAPEHSRALPSGTSVLRAGEPQCISLGGAGKPFVEPKLGVVPPFQGANKNVHLPLEMMRAPKGTSSRFRGVSWNRQAGRWKVQIQVVLHSFHCFAGISDELPRCAALLTLLFPSFCSCKGNKFASGSLTTRSRRQKNTTNELWRLGAL